jgi:hypothetical protein
MTTFTENFEKLSKLQQEGLEPVREFTGVAVEAFEKFARKNYAVYGDVLDFTIQQTRAALETTDAKELLETQIERSKGFAQLLATHANEYFEIGKSVQEEAVAAAPAATKPAATKKAA